MQRAEQAPVEDRFIERWSPRSFDENDKITDKDLKTIFEAARWSPSCFNIQPWRFLYAKSQDKYFESFCGLLAEANRVWASKASAVGFIICENKNHKGEDNFYAKFDTGSAWMALTMQARELGYFTHGMGGIKHEEVYKKLNIDPKKFTVICGFALGKKAPKEDLPEKLQEQENLSTRKNLDNIMFNGIFKEEK